MDPLKNQRIILVPKDKNQSPVKKIKPNENFFSVSHVLNIRQGKSKKLFYFVISASILSLAAVLIWPDNTPTPTHTPDSSPSSPSGTLLEIIENESYRKEPNILRDNQLFVDLVAWKNAGLSDQVEAKVRQILKTNSLEYLPKGCGVNFYYSKSNNGLVFISIEPEPGIYAVISLYPYVSLQHFKKNIQLVTIEKSAVIGEVGGTNLSANRLYLALEENQIPSQIIPFMEKALSWTVDLHHLNIGDKFKLIYEVKAVDGTPLEITKLKAIYLDNGEKELFGFYVDQLDTTAFYDEKGRSLKKKFLMAPIKYARISSSYDKNRKNLFGSGIMPHLGTDYAAETGTPVFSVGDGVVTAVATKKNNGNFVKIKHDNMYETQYLHLHGFAPGLTVGRRVSQGEVIGYVGETGRVTGPHVCFRFWKNNEQVNHLTDDSVGQPGNSTLDLEERQIFITNRDTLMNRLYQISYR